MEMENIREQELDIRSYLRVLRKRKWTIMTVFMLVVVIAAIQVFRATPIYRASGRMVIEKENPNIVSVQEVLSMDAASSEYFQTQFKIIESQSVAREVIRRLDLQNSLEFYPEPRDDLISRAQREVRSSIGLVKAWASAIMKSGDGEEEAEASAGNDIPLPLIAAVIERIQVEPVRNSRLVDVGVEAADPRLAAQMANTVIRAYIDLNLETKLNATKDAVSWLTERIDEERAKVEMAENALLEYKQKHGIITNFSSERESMTAENLAGINSQVIEAESKRVEAETRYRQALKLAETPEFLDAIPEVMQNELVQEIKRMEVELLNRMTEFSKKYGKNHPRMVAIESELAELQKRKTLEAERIVNTLRNEYRLALAREQSLRGALNNQKAESLDMNKKAIQYGVLQRAAESSRQMYELLIKRFKETSLSEEMKAGNIRVIDEAPVPERPIKPDKKRNLMLAIVLGLFLGIGLAFLLEYMDNTIKIPEEIDEHLAIPYLGPVPAFDAKEAGGEYSGELITANSPTASASESFRGIRTSILFSSPDHAPQVIAVTSAGPGEGKTLFAGNLAVTMARNDAKVLLVDCDLRRPRLHDLFNKEREPGLTGTLVGTRNFDEAVFPSGIPNMDVLFAGHIPPNPSELLASGKMRSFLEEMRKRYDRIIMDTPPVLSVTDPVALSTVVDGVIMVIRTAITPRPVIRGAVDRLRGVNAPILGAVLNAVNPRREGYYYQYHYYYGYGEDQKRRRGHSKVA